MALVTNLESIFAATPEQCRGADVHYVEEDQPLPELHSLAALVHKRRIPFAFEDEFRLIYMLRPEEEISVDDPADFFRLIPADPAKLVHELRFHPAASMEFKDRVRAILAAGHWNIPVRNSSFSAT